MKKIICLLVLIFVLCGCNTNNSTNDNNNQTNVSSSSVGQVITEFEAEKIFLIQYSRYKT